MHEEKLTECQIFYQEKVEVPVLMTDEFTEEHMYRFTGRIRMVINFMINSGAYLREGSKVGHREEIEGL